MPIKRGEFRLRPRQMGVCLGDIAEGDFGSALFEKVPGSGEYYEFEVKAIEYVREHHECWVVDDNNGITEHTPQELRAETSAGIPYRITDLYPLPVTISYVYRDYHEESYTATESEYTIGTDAHTARSSSPESFTALSTLLIASTDCYVRINESDDVQIKLNAGIPYSFGIRITKLYIQRVTTNGVLQIYAGG